MSGQPFSHSDLQTMVIDAFDNVFDTMMSLKIEHKGAQYFPSDSEDAAPPPILGTSGVVITSSVGFTGVVQGVVYYAVDEELAKKLTCTFLGMEPEEVEEEGNPTINDALGEIANMSVGVFKNRICDKGYHCMLSLPSIVRGTNIEIQSNLHAGVMRQVHHFQACEMPLVVDLIFKSE